MSDINQLQSLLASGIDNHLYSCAQLVISDAKHDIANLYVGKTRLNYGKNDSNCRANAITSETLFDVASLTKPIATTSLVMQALAERMFSLKQKLITLNSFPLPSWCLGCTIEELLSHQTPLPAWFDFHETLPRREDHETAKRAFAIACQKLNPRDDNQSWCYSDIGFIILGFLLESIYGMELDKLFSQKVAEPLGLESQMMYRPLHHVDRSTIAATCPYQDAYIQGHPDDANARALTHIAGHAGLFASARAIAAFVRSLISHSFPCPASIIDQFLTYRSPRTPFALGWDRPTSDDSLSARKAGDNVIGHLGFTGCSVWIDLDTKRSVTLLTNRTHMNDNPKSIADLRRKIHKLSWELP